MDPTDLLTARGVTSKVRTDGHDRGHVLLLDYDGGVPYERTIDDTKGLPGPTFVFESSPDSYHVWNLTVRTKAETALQMLATKGDPMHTSVGFRRGQWTLRVGSKNRVNASAGFDDLPDRYKEAPVPFAGWVNETDRPVSLPHLRLAVALGHNHDLESRARDRCGDLVGTEYRAETYLTLTDEGKADV